MFYDDDDDDTGLDLLALLTDIEAFAL